MPGDGGGLGPGAWIVLGAIWMGAASLSGLVLAFLARRIHPGLSLVRLWAFYSILNAFLVAAVFLIGFF